MIFARWICKRRGHEIDPDPGDFVLYCMRCHAMVDLIDVLPDKIRQTRGGDA